VVVSGSTSPSTRCLPCPRKTGKQLATLHGRERVGLSTPGPSASATGKAVEGDGRASSQPSSLSPVVMYHGLARHYLMASPFC
jgi:hypothetical protein